MAEPISGTTQRRSREKALAILVKAEQRDASERVQCLRLQATAWRQLALIGLVDPAKGSQLARWLFSISVPFVNGEALEKFITEHHDEARDAGFKAGVFDPPALRALVEGAGGQS